MLVPEDVQLGRLAEHEATRRGAVSRVEPQARKAVEEAPDRGVGLQAREVHADAHVGAVCECHLQPSVLAAHVEAVDHSGRRLEPQRLLDGVRQQPAILVQERALLGIGEQVEDRVRDHALGRLDAAEQEHRGVRDHLGALEAPGLARRGDQRRAGVAIEHRLHARAQGGEGVSAGPRDRVAGRDAGHGVDDRVVPAEQCGRVGALETERVRDDPRRQRAGEGAAQLRTPRRLQRLDQPLGLGLDQRGEALPHGVEPREPRHRLVLAQSREQWMRIALELLESGRSPDRKRPLAPMPHRLAHTLIFALTTLRARAARAVAESGRADISSPAVTAIRPDVVEEAGRLLETAESRGLPLRVLGGVAIRMRAPVELPPALRRSYADADFLTAKGASGRAQEFFRDEGYEPQVAFNALHGRERLLFFDNGNDRQVDVFVGRFEMSHKVPVAERMGLEPRTLPLAELLITKLQIAELNEKDVRDALALFHGHAVNEGDGDSINAARVAQLCATDWGLWRTLTGNLAICREHLPGYELGEEDEARIAKGIDALLARMEREPKSRGWKLRAKIGERKRWYTTPEEVAGGP